MIAFECSSCGKPLKVKDELAGKKVKCPGCQKPVGVPQPAVSVSPPPAVREDERTLPPKAPSPGEERTLPPKEAGKKESLSDADGHTNLGAGQAESTQAFAAAGHNSELTDFLAPPQQPDELGRLGGFRILKILGHGGMGVVFQGEDPMLGRKVAIKAMLPHLAGSKSSQEQFLREAKSAAALEHDHIVPIFHVAVDCGAPFIVMPFLQGEPLDERLKQEKILPVAEVLRIGRETAKGLAAAHEKGLIHRDIKPANIWLEGKDSRVKILDFGLARAASETGLTQTGAIVGTPQYMAPEQAAGKKDIDHRCDLFSLGCVLYRMSTGQLPFKGDDTLAIISSLAMDKPKEPSKVNKKVPQPLSNLIMHLLAKNPENRPQSAHEVAEALAQLSAKDTAEMPAKAGKTTLFQKPHAAASRRKWTLVGGGMLGLAVLGLVVFFLTSRERDRPENDSKQSAEALSKTFTNSLGMEFVLIPKGKSWLGGSGGRPGTKEVDMPYDFYLGRYEVTQADWEKVTGLNPSQFKAVAGVTKEDQKRFPVENVSWDDCQAFIERLNKQVKDAGWVYRLPTEVEWEYACRGGPMIDKLESPFDYYFEKPSNTLLLEQANWENGKGLKRTCKVGSYQPNKLGLYDMHGNVWEWCADEMKDDKGLWGRARRGGGWCFGAITCPAGARSPATPTFGDRDLGLRLARVPVGKEPVAPKPPEEKKTETPTSTFTNTLGMEFVLVPKGKSWLGGGGGKPGDKEVEIKEDFYLGKYEVTQEEWEKVMGSNPSGFSRSGAGKDMVTVIPDADLKHFPVEQVSWNDAQLFLKVLNAQAKETGWLYRLPKEAEWEYACRGGPMVAKMDGAFDFYLEKPTDRPPNNVLNCIKEKGRTCRVGSYAPNRLGLYDMHGNVFEWCDDAANFGDGVSRRVLRGGGWNVVGSRCDATGRSLPVPSYKSDDSGLRLARVPVGKEIVKIIAPEEKKPAKEAKQSPTFKNTLGMEFVLVPKGKSWLGGGNGKPGDKEVEIKEDFYLGKYEVTQEEWQAVTGVNPSHFSRTGAGKDVVKDIPDADLKRFPVESVSWKQAQLFVEALNARQKDPGWVYRLPKEAEWEYACREGPTSNKFDCAFDFYVDKPAKVLLPEQANFEHGKGLKRTCKVGSYSPNRLGLHDMHGNVCEWCEDEVPDRYNPKGAGLPRSCSCFAILDPHRVYGNSWEDDTDVGSCFQTVHRTATHWRHGPRHYRKIF